MNSFVREVLATVFAMLAFVAIGFFIGHKFSEGKIEKLKSEHAQSVREFERQLSYEGLMFELERQELVKRARGKIRLVEKEIEKPVYRDCVLPDDGMRIHADTVQELNTPAQPRR